MVFERGEWFRVFDLESWTGDCHRERRTMSTTSTTSTMTTTTTTMIQTKIKFSQEQKISNVIKDLIVTKHRKMNHNVLLLNIRRRISGTDFSDENLERVFVDEVDAAEAGLQGILQNVEITEKIG